MCCKNKEILSCYVRDLHINVGERFIADETFDSTLVILCQVFLVLRNAFHVILLLELLPGVQLDRRLLLEAELLVGPDLPHSLIKYLPPEKNMLHVVLFPVRPDEFEPSSKFRGIEESSNSG